MPNTGRGEAVNKFNANPALLNTREGDCPARWGGVYPCPRQRQAERRRRPRDHGRTGGPAAIMGVRQRHGEGHGTKQVTEGAHPCDRRRSPVACQLLGLPRAGRPQGGDRGKAFRRPAPGCHPALPCLPARPQHRPGLGAGRATEVPRDRTSDAGDHGHRPCRRARGGQGDFRRRLRLPGQALLAGPAAHCRGPPARYAQAARSHRQPGA